MTWSADGLAIEYFDGTDHNWLSNFHEGNPFRWHSMTDLLPGTHHCRTGEHAFQAEKASNASDFVKVITASGPGLAKRLGRGIRLDPEWEARKDDVMRAVLRAKFADPELAELLMATGDAQLIEGNHWHDQIWGNCVCGRSACRLPGQNRLGRMLMGQRNELILQREGC